MTSIAVSPWMRCACVYAKRYLIILVQLVSSSSIVLKYSWWLYHVYVFLVSFFFLTLQSFNKHLLPVFFSTLIFSNYASFIAFFLLLHIFLFYFFSVFFQQCRREQSSRCTYSCIRNGRSKVQKVQ